MFFDLRKTPLKPIHFVTFSFWVCDGILTYHFCDVKKYDQYLHYMLATYGIENKLEIMLKTKWQFWTFE